MPILSSLGALKTFNVKAYSGTGNIGYYTTNAQFLNDCTDGTYIYISGVSSAGNFTLRLDGNAVLNRQYNTTSTNTNQTVDTVFRNGVLYKFGANTISVSNRVSTIINYPNPDTSSSASTTMTTYTNYALTHISPYLSGGVDIFYGSGIRESTLALKPTFFRIGGSVWYKNITELGSYDVACCAVSSANTVFYSILTNTGTYFGYNFLFNATGTILYQKQITATHSTYGNENAYIIKAAFDSSNNLYCLAEGSDTGTGYLIKLDSTLTVTWCKQISTNIANNVLFDTMKLYVDSSYVYIIPGINQDVSVTGTMQLTLIKLDKTLLDGTGNPIVWANLFSLPLYSQITKNALYVIGDRISILFTSNPSSSPITSSVISVSTDGKIPYRGAFSTPYNFTIGKTNAIMETISAFSIDTTYTTTTDTAFTSTLNTPTQTTSTLTWNNASFGT